MSRKFYVTTPIYYVNAPPHMGTAYTTILADTLARTKRMLGYDALVVTGSDEHSQGIADRAAAEGMHPEEFCRQFIPQFHEAWKLLNIGPYKFCRTSSPEHKVVVQAFFQRIFDKGDIYKAQYSGWYHTTDNRFVDEAELPENPESHPNLKFLTEDAYWFKLSAYQDQLMAWHEAHPEAIIPNFRRNEMLQRIREGLRDLRVFLVALVENHAVTQGEAFAFLQDHVAFFEEDGLAAVARQKFEIDAFIERDHDAVRGRFASL